MRTLHEMRQASKVPSMLGTIEGTQDYELIVIGDVHAVDDVGLYQLLVHERVVMSTEAARREIERFLASDEPEVLCLKGKWGVGKTYAWTAFLAAAKEADALALARYSYVSLFGLTSIDQFRLSIVENSIKTEDIGEKITVEKILADPLRVGTSHYRKALSYVRFVPGGKDIAELVQAASFLAIRQQLICIDDLERKGDGLKIKDVLGLVSYLKDHRDCKIVLILNDGAFDKNEKEDFQTYFEKTVDSHVVFAPSVEQCAEIALAENTPLHSAMREHCITLRVSNIRVIRRVERLGRLLVPILSPYDPRVFQGAIKTLTLLGWCVYGEDAPPLEFVKNRRIRLHGKEKPSEEETKWGPVLDSYDFLYFSDLASLIADGIQNGYFDDVALRQQASKLDAGHQAQGSEEEFHRAWRLYHDSFGDDEEALIDGLAQALRKNAKYISPMNANSTFKLLREFGKGELATDLIKIYVDAKEPEAFERQALFHDSDIDDPEFAEAVATKKASKVDNRSIGDILFAIARNQSWHPDDIDRLASFSTDAFYAAFKELKDERLAILVKTALSFGSNDKEKTIAARAREALVRVGRESELNKRRVGKFGINVDDADPST